MILYCGFVMNIYCGKMQTNARLWSFIREYCVNVTGGFW